MQLAVLFGICVVGCAVAPIALSQAPASEPADVSDDTESETPAALTPETLEATDDSEARSETEPASPLYGMRAGKIETVGPDTFILLDEKGNPKQYLGWIYEDFLAVWKKHQGVSETPQDAQKKSTLDELQLFGTVEPGYAALTAKFVYQIHTAERVELPLRLGNTFPQRLLQSPRQAGDRQAGDRQLDDRHLGYSAERQEFYVALQAEPGETVTLEVELVAPLQRDGNRATLRLLLPRAAKSSLDLVSEEAITKVVASDGIVLASGPMAAGGWQVKTTGMNNGEFTLSWEEPLEDADPLAPLLGATGEILATIDGQSVRTKARITVRSFGGPFREFSVRLPPNAQRILRAHPAPIDSVTEDPSGEERADIAHPGTLLRVQLNKETTGPVTLDLETDQQIGVPKESSPVELAGFEVLGAVRQHGQIAVVVDNEWQLRWDINDSVEQVSASEIERTWKVPPPETDQIAAALRYSRQPWSLPVRLSPRRRRVVAKPSYSLSIKPGEALLRLRVDYHIVGIRSFPDKDHLPISFAIGDWSLEEHSASGLDNTQEFEQTVEMEPADDVEPEDDVEAEDEIETEDGALPEEFEDNPPPSLVKFGSATATTQRPYIELLLRKSLPTGDGEDELELPLPFLQEGRLAIENGELLVDVDPSLLIKPAMEQSTGLDPQPVERTTQLVGSDGPQGQRFRYRGSAQQLVFAASKMLRPRRVEVRIDSRVEVVDDRLEVVQHFDYDVRHQKIDSILLQAPAALLRQHNLELELLTQPGSADGQSELWTHLDYPIDSGDGLGQAGLPVTLPHPEIGKFRIRARYSLARPPELSAGGTFILPLVSSILPELDEGKLTEHALSLPMVNGQVLKPVENTNWTVENNSSEENERTTLTTASPDVFLPLTLSAKVLGEGSLTLEQVWVQSWLTPRVMQERVVFRFSGAGQTVTIELPADTAQEGEVIEVTLDNKVVADAPVVTNGRLEIEVPGDSTLEVHTLELRYRRERPLGWTESLRVERPRLRGNAGQPVVDWQVVVPVKLSLIGSPDGLVKAFRSRWSAGDWRAVAERNTTQLENSIGALRQMTPTQGEQAYLFRTIDPSAPLEATFVRRELIVLVISAAVLALCLAVAYVPWLRRPPVVLSALALAAIAGLAYPETAALLGQAGILGALCGGGGVLLAILAKRSRPQTLQPLTSPSSSILSTGLSTGTRDSTEHHVGPGSVSSNAPTVAVDVADPS